MSFILDTQKHILHVEVCLLRNTPATLLNEIEELIRDFIKNQCGISKSNLSLPSLSPKTIKNIDLSSDPLLPSYVSFARIDGIDDPLSMKEGTDILIHPFYFSEEEGVLNTSIEEEEEFNFSSKVYLLPSRNFQGLWESLHFDGDMKGNALSYLTALMAFSDRNVDNTIISYNRMVLFHGPPGTGKTTLSKALANKASIYFSKKHAKMVLVEINAHSLFSKWFSESGKRVLELFDHIRALASEPNSFVFALVDEIESLTTARKSSASGSDPTDAIRVVNALLTQIDSLSKSKNIILLATTNLTEVIDDAFLDRADLKIKVGLPSVSARYDIVKTCVLELMHRGFIRQTSLSFYGKVESDPLMKVAMMTEGWSGRALRKLPCQAYSYYLSSVQYGTISVVQFLQAVEYVLLQNNKEE